MNQRNKSKEKVGDIYQLDSFPVKFQIEGHKKEGHKFGLISYMKVTNKNTYVMEHIAIEI